MAAAGPSSTTAGAQTLFGLIHELHDTITRSVDTALSWDVLGSPPINYSLIRPLISRLSEYAQPRRTAKGPTRGSGKLAVPSKTAEGGGRGNAQLGLGSVFVQFLTLSGSELSSAPLQNSRAAFCELLAIKLLRACASGMDEVTLVEQLVRGRCAFAGAPESVWAGLGDDRKNMEEARSSALELAIVSRAKRFLSLPLIQHLTKQIYTGKLIYTPTSSRSLIADPYVSDRTKQRRRNSHSQSPGPSNGLNPKDEEVGDLVFVYNPYEAGWLDHQRLRVPKWRNLLEFLQFSILLGLFIATLSTRDINRLTPIEAISILFTLGFVLDEFATSKEHGWTVYSANAWNAFDISYIAVWFLYLLLRIFGLASASPSTSDLAFDILACGACILFPRLVFFAIRDNVIILALKAMIARFIGFMGLTILAFSGICFCLWTLGRATWTVRQIIWLMLQIWFGSSYLGFSASESFHPIFGPVILISYAALCNVLLITILIAILSNIFAEINANAQDEHLFQKVVKTVEGVKSDAVFSYLSPINLIALVTLVPLSYLCEPRTLHRINVFAIRATNFPILIGISLYERYQYRRAQQALYLPPGAREQSMTTLWDGFLGGGSEEIIASVFEAGPPPSATGNRRPPPGLSVETPPRASSITSGGSSSEAEDQDLQSKVPDSPLARIFGSSRLAPKPVPIGRDAGPRTNVGGDQDEVSRLRKELDAVRESQMRMEEMLGKMMAGLEGSK